MNSLKIEPAVSEDFAEICDSDFDNTDKLDDKFDLITNRVIPFGAAIKCGEIILESRRKFILVCGLCPKEFDSLGSFSEHIFDKHLGVAARYECKPFECLFLSEKACQPVPTDFIQKINSAEIQSNQLDGSNVIEGLTTISEKYVHEDVPNNLHTSSVPSMPEEIPLEDQSHEKLKDADRKKRDEDDPLPIKYTCKACNTGYRHKKSYVAHARKHHGMITKSMKKSIDADTAKLIEAIDKIRRRKQITQARKKKMYPCPKCDHVCKTNKELMSHVGSAHGAQVLKVLLRKYPCKYCGDELDNVKDLNAHVDVCHTGDAKYPCHHCSKIFKTFEGQRIHVYTHTGERPLKCPHCPKRFAVASNLRMHIFMHLNIKNYACKYCDKKFVQSTDRNIHEARHTGNKPFQCERCGKQFITSTLLVYHRRRHQNLRVYKCDLCDKAYFTSTSLNEHKERHTGNRIYKCVTCSRSFVTRKSLKQHERLHMKDKQFVCACGKAFRHSSGLNNHRKAHASIIV